MRHDLCDRQEKVAGVTQLGLSSQGLLGPSQGRMAGAGYGCDKDVVDRQFGRVDQTDVCLEKRGPGMSALPDVGVPRLDIDPGYKLEVCGVSDGCRQGPSAAEQFNCPEGWIGNNGSPDMKAPDRQHHVNALEGCRHPDLRMVGKRGKQLAVGDIDDRAVPLRDPPSGNAVRTVDHRLEANTIRLAYDRECGAG